LGKFQNNQQCQNNQGSPYNGGEDQDSTLKKEDKERVQWSHHLFSGGIFGTNVTEELFSKFQNIILMLLSS
jgi:hypothetical protein